MDLFENTYYNFAKTMASLVGLWPYQEPKTRILRIVISYAVLFLVTSSLFAKLFTIEYNVDEVIDILSFLIPSVCYFTGYIMLHFNVDKVKTFLELIRADWTMLQNSEEVDIIKRYAMKSKQITIVMTAIFYFFLLLTIFDFTLPALLDIIIPLNETRERKFLIPFETYFKIEDTTVGVTFIALLLIVLGLTALTVYSWFLIGIYHTCGMFDITGYILEHTFDESDQYVYANKECEVIRKKIIRTIGFHMRAIKFFDHLKSLTEVCYSIQISLAMFAIATQYAKMMLLSKEALMEDTSYTISFFLGVSGIIFSVFINCHAGQEIINHSIDIFNKAAVSPWYLTPKNTQTLAILILMRSQAPCFLGIGKTFVSSYEFFVSLLKTSMSYATVCYTMK